MESELSTILFELGYMSEATSEVPTSSLLLFCHVNSLGQPELAPRSAAISYAWHAVKERRRLSPGTERTRGLKQNPGTEVPLINAETGETQIVLKGPFMSLDILARLGFLKGLEPGIDSFLWTNRRKMSDLIGKSLDEKLNGLHEAFNAEKLQRWRGFVPKKEKDD